MLLAIESATADVGVALVDGDGVRAAFTVRPGRRHVETLHPLIADVTGRAGVSLFELDALAVDVGPGLFTGIRVGVAAAKALAFALGLPLIGLTSTDVLLAAAHAASPAAAVVDLRRGEVAWATSEGALPSRGTLERCAASLAESGAPLLLVGDGARRHGARLAALVEAAGGRAPRLGGEALDAPPVTALARLALRAHRDGGEGDPFAVAPCYLREADVRIGWTTRADDAAIAAAGGGD